MTRPTLAEYLANPDAFPEVARSDAGFPTGTRVGKPEMPGMRRRYHQGWVKTSEYVSGRPRLPPLAEIPNFRRRGAGVFDLATPLALDDMPVGPGGVIDRERRAPPMSITEATQPRLMDALRDDPFAELREALRPRQADAGYTPGQQSNGMRVPPAPANFGESAATDLDAAWATARARALPRTRADLTEYNRPNTPAETLFNLVMGHDRRRDRGFSYELPDVYKQTSPNLGGLFASFDARRRQQLTR